MNGSQAIIVGAALALAPLAALAATPAPPPAMPPVAAAAFNQAHAVKTYPSFADVAPAPKDVRSFQAWKTSITTLKTAGADFAHLAAIEPWTLDDTAAWAAQERARDVPPPQITVASTPAETEAYAAALRARATPPPRKR